MKKITDWEPYDAEGGGYIPAEQWGKDHWSLLAYVEGVTVDFGNIIDNRKMRCNPRLHRPLANIGTFGDVVDGSKYPTKLKSGEVAGHDDWSCLEDLVAAGLVTAEIGVANPRAIFGGQVARVKLTPLGCDVASQLRNWRRNGGSYAQFEPKIGATA